MAVRIPPLVVAWLAAITLSAGATATEPLALEPLASGLWLHRGQHADIDDPRRADSANLAVIEGRDCVAVVDAGGARATGAALLAALRARTAKPLCYLIETHVHFDHVLGAAALLGEGTRVVGHAGLAEALVANRDYFADAFADELAGSTLPAPDLLVETTEELDLGDRVLRLEAHDIAHSTADLTVLDVATDTLFAGDLLFRERLPVIDGSLRGWLAWMERARAAHHALVVPGHGPPDNAWPAGSDAQYAYLLALRDDTRRAIAAGVALEDAAGAVGQAALAGWQLTGRAHAVNASRAYRELEWE